MIHAENGKIQHSTKYVRQHSVRNWLIIVTCLNWYGEKIVRGTFQNYKSCTGATERIAMIEEIILNMLNRLPAAELVKRNKEEKKIYVIEDGKIVKAIQEP